MNDNNKISKKFFQSGVEDYKKEFYESGYRTFMSVRLKRFIDEIGGIGLKKGAICLDAGCGPGYLTKILFEKEYNVSALDSSPEMLRLTKDHFRSFDDSKQPAYVEGDIESLPFENEYFDVVASAGVIEYLPNDDKVMSEFYRVLKPGGHLILSSTNKYSPIGCFEPIIESTKRISMFRNAINWLLKLLGGTPIRSREFKVRKHTRQEFVKNASLAGFDVKTVGYFYGLPWPHPFDRVFPRMTHVLGSQIEKLNHTLVGRTFEGIYIVAKKK